VVHAPDLSEGGLRCGVEARHTYVKVTGNGGPDLRFSARPWGDRTQRAILGDVVRAQGASFHVRVRGGAGDDLRVVKDGVAGTPVPITSDDFDYRFEGAGSGHWLIRVDRGRVYEIVSSPIWIEPGSGPRPWVERTRCRGSHGWQTW
jgi:hypothetical protein